MRRRWPQTLISWTRVLAGRLRDPLVGRDVLVGAACGNDPGVGSSARPGEPPSGTGAGNDRRPRRAVLPAAIGLLALPVPLHGRVLFRGVPVHALLSSRPCCGEPGSLASCCSLSSWRWRSAAGKDPLATSVKSAISRGDHHLGSGPLRPALVGNALVHVYSPRGAPLTLDWSEWYAGRSFAVLFSFVAVLLLAFYTSLGGKPLFGRALLED